MDEMNDLIAKLREVSERNSAYKFEAYSFVMGALNFALSRLDKPRHLTGQEFCQGLREFALSQYGPLTLMVLEHWGIHRTRDFGEIVFSLVDAGLMSKTPEDTVTDFDNVYDFKEAFTGPLEFDLEDLSMDWDEDAKDAGGHG